MSTASPAADSAPPVFLLPRSRTTQPIGDDVLAVIESLKLNRPVLVGHSIAGEESSSVGSRFPDKVAGLIYLDSGYSYAYYDRSLGNLWIDSIDLRRKLAQLIPGRTSEPAKQVVEDLIQNIPQFERILLEWHQTLEAMPMPPTPVTPGLTPAQAILEGQRKYTNIPVPILAIYAIPHDFGPVFKDPIARAAAEARDMVYSGDQAKAFEHGLPNARVVRLPHASHLIFGSNEADVLAEMHAFLASLN